MVVVIVVEVLLRRVAERGGEGVVSARVRDWDRRSAASWCLGGDFVGSGALDCAGDGARMSDDEMKVSTKGPGDVQDV